MESSKFAQKYIWQDQGAQAGAQSKLETAEIQDKNKCKLKISDLYWTKNRVEEAGNFGVADEFHGN